MVIVFFPFTMSCDLMTRSMVKSVVPLLRAVGSLGSRTGVGQRAVEDEVGLGDLARKGLAGRGTERAGDRGCRGQEQPDDGGKNQRRVIGWASGVGRAHGHYSLASGTRGKRHLPPGSGILRR